MLISTAGKTTEPFQRPKRTPGVIRRHLGRSRWMSAPCSATAMQITNNMPWFRMMKWQHSGDGSARCSVYSFGQLTPDINNQRKTAADCLPLLVPDRGCRRAVTQRESTHSAVTLLSLAAGWRGSLCFLQAMVLYCSRDFCTAWWLWTSAWTYEEPGKLLRRQSLLMTLGGFLLSLSHGRSGAGAEIQPWLAKPTSDVVAAWDSVVQDGSSCVPPEAAAAPALAPPLAPHNPKSIPDDDRGCFQQWHLESWWRF